MTEPLAERFPLPPSATTTVPTEGARSFGAPRDHGRRSHEGVDLFAPRGTPVESPVTGRVVATLDDASANCGFGVVVRSSADGTRWTLCHLAAMPIVERGERIDAGTVVGVVGSSGNARPNGPHLHIHGRARDGRTVNVTESLIRVLDAQRIDAPSRTPQAPAVRPRARSSSAAPLVVVAVLAAIVLRRKK